MQALPLTVIILTLNEEENLAGAINSVKGWARDIFIVDSLSADRTVDVALEHNVRIVQRPFSNYGDQWQWALENLPITTPWVFKLDADERVSPELKEEIRQTLSREPHENGFIVKIRLWFVGRPLHAMVKTCRLWRKDKGGVSKVAVNEHVIVQGRMGKFKGFIEHMDSPDLHRWFEKQNRYTTMEALMRFKNAGFAAKPNVFGNALERRMFFKKIFFRIPGRYLFQWLYEALVRGAFWDGEIGRIWIHLRIEVNRAIEFKVKEMRLTGKILEPPKDRTGTFDPRVQGHAKEIP